MSFKKKMLNSSNPTEYLAQYLKLHVTFLSFTRGVIYQSSRICPVCQSPIENPMQVNDKLALLKCIEDTLTFKNEGPVLAFPVKMGITVVTQECSCLKGKGDQFQERSLNYAMAMTAMLRADGIKEVWAKGYHL